MNANILFAKHWKIISVISVNLTVLILLVFLGLKMVQFKKDESDRHHKTLALIQRLDAGITFQSKRQKLLLEMQNTIIGVAHTAKVEMTLEKAFRIAEANLYAAEKYKIDPILLLAIQTQENRFSVDRVSPAGALGHNQIWEPTGRLLCRCLGWDYSPEILTDINKSTELAALNIQIFMVSYNKYENQTELVVAAYNGGPRNAEYYRTKDARLAPETAEYVPLVLNFYKQYIEVMGTYVIGVGIERVEVDTSNTPS